MGKLLTLIALVVIAAWLVRRALRRAATPGAPEAGTASGELVRCAQCGLLLPRAEARESAGATYCSEEHARLGPAARAPRGR